MAVTEIAKVVSMAAAGWAFTASCRSFHFCDEAACGARPAVAVEGGSGGDANEFPAGAAGMLDGRGGAAPALATGGSSAAAAAGLTSLGGAHASAGGSVASEDAGSSGAALGGESASGAGGDPGVVGGSCAPPFAECDGSSFTPCETDLKSSPLHCGACQRKCWGACFDGRCLSPTTLIEQLSPIDRGLLRIGRDFYALSDDRLYTFQEGLQFALELAPGIPGLRALEAAPNRLYLGDARHWWSASADSPEELVDERVTALDAKYMDDAFYWLDENQVVRVKDSRAPEGAPYCVLPAASFDVDSAVLARTEPGAVGVFRRSFWASDVVSCPPFNAATLAQPVSGRVIASGAPSQSGAAQSGVFYWNDGVTLLRAEAESPAEVFFAAPAEAMSLGPIAIAGRYLFLAFSGLNRGGLHLLALDSSQPPRTIGTLSEIGALFVDESSAKLCYADLRGNRVACLGFSELGLVVETPESR